MKRAGLISLCLLAGAAQAGDLRPAPAYVTEMFTAVYAAETLAKWCPAVAVDEARVEASWQVVFVQLGRDGFDMSRADGGFVDPTGDVTREVEAWADLRMLDESSSTAEVCAAADLEMTGATTIGGFLKAEGA